MKISYNWLQDNFGKKLPSPEEIKEKVIMHAFEVESLDEVDALGEKDYLFDIKILPNRAHDCNGHLGIAKEIAVLFDLPIKHHGPADFPISSNVPAVKVVVEDSELCPRYMGRIIKNIKVGESPAWLKSRLSAIGQRSINNIVDIANYVMFQTSQPLHIFDADKISGNTINIRPAKDGEKMTTLDGKLVNLDPLILIISDDVDALAIAGIKGGMKAATTAETKNIILESANFTAAPIRRTSQKIGIRTDASFRFEHELAPELAEAGMAELTRLVMELAGTDDIEVGAIVDIFPSPRGIQQISFDKIDIPNILGISMDEQTIESLLARFKAHANFDWEKDGDKYTVMVPNERLDLINLHGQYSGGVKEDIIEELGRVNGYENIPFVPLSVVSQGPVNKLRYYTELIRDVLVAEGFSEVYNYSIVGPGIAGQTIELRNPLADDKKYLRTNLHEELGKKLLFNIHNKDLLGVDQVRIFEVGRVFPSYDVDGERVHCAIAIESLKKQDVIAELERIVSILKEKTEIADIKIIENKATKDSGVIEFDLEVSIDKLPTPEKYQDNSYVSVDTFYQSISLFPFVARDIAVFVPVEISADDVFAIIAQGSLVQLPNLLINHKLFDVFTKTFPDGSKKTSYAFRLVFQAKNRTLTGEEVGVIMDKITALLNSTEGFQVR